MNELIKIMSGYRFIVLCLLFAGCKPKPEFYSDGKPCYTRVRCVESHVEDRVDYHWGYSPVELKYCWHVGWHRVNVCDRQVVDTLEIKY